MDKTLKLNKVVDVIFGIALISTLLLLTNGSLIVFATCPILLAIIYLTHGRADYLMVTAGGLLMGLFFTDVKSLAYSAIGLIVVSLLFIFLTRSSLSDKKQIGICFLVVSALMIGSYKYAMVTSDYNLASIASELKKSVEMTSSYDLPMQLYRLAVSMYPAILAGFGLIYSILALKIIRNYMAYKGIGKDMTRLNNLRISKKDSGIILGISIISYGILTLLGFKSTYIISNLIWLWSVFLLLNGIAVYDYMMVSSKSSFARIMQWVFVILFFSLFALIFMIFGLLDIFIDLRRKVRRPHAEK